MLEIGEMNRLLYNEFERIKKKSVDKVPINTMAKFWPFFRDLFKFSI